MWLLTLALACTTPDPAPPTPGVVEPPTPGPEAQTRTVELERQVAPAGSIGGTPILHKPIVLGAVDAGAVDAAVDALRPAIGACWDPASGRTGRILVRFVIDDQGHVDKQEIRSTSLRHPPTEACVADLFKGATFPAPASGGIAIASYPFAFPPAP